MLEPGQTLEAETVNGAGKLQKKVTQAVEGVYGRQILERREGDVEKEERDAAREWLAHVEARRIG